MVETAVLPLICEIGLPGEVEAYDYLLAVERAELPGFRLGHVVARDDGRVVAPHAGLTS